MENDPSSIYLKINCTNYENISKNDLKVRFLQIDLKPKMIFIDENKARILILFQSKNCVEKFENCLLVNKDLFDFVKDFSVLTESEVVQFNAQFEEKRRRNAAVRSLKKTKAVQKTKGIKGFVGI